MLTIRPSLADDRNQIWEILQATIKEGDAFAFSPDSSKEEMLNYWFSEGKKTYTAVMDNNVVGTFFIQNNQRGLGSHIANAGYCTSPKFYGRGIGKQMGQFSLDEARKLGYKAMQFNIVVKTNTTAVKLWQEIGFQIIGEIPDAFQHQRLGLVDAYIMYQKL